MKNFSAGRSRGARRRVPPAHVHKLQGWGGRPARAISGPGRTLLISSGGGYQSTRTTCGRRRASRDAFPPPPHPRCSTSGRFSTTPEASRLIRTQRRRKSVRGEDGETVEARYRPETIEMKIVRINVKHMHPNDEKKDDFFFV